MEIIPLVNRGTAFDTYLLVYHNGPEGQWHITNIEAYADPLHTKLLADDITPADFNHDQQRKLYSALNADHEARLSIARMLKARKAVRA